MPFLDMDGEMAGANGADSPNADENKAIDAGLDFDVTDEDIQYEDSAGDSDTEGTGETPDDKGIEYTKAFSDRLKRAREHDLEKIAELERQLQERSAQDNDFNRLLGVLGQYGYEGGASEISDFLEAQSRQTTPEQIKAEREAQQKLIDEAVANNPFVIQAREIAIQSKIDNDLREIQKYNPNIHSIRDLANDPNADIINAMVQMGATYAEAYVRVNGITKAQPKPVDTKSHLNGIGGGTGGGGAEMKEIPQSELNTWRVAFPDLTLKELRAKYNSSLKRQEEF